MFSLLKSVGSGNRQERKITSEGKKRDGRWRKKALVLDSPQYLLPETNGQNCERAENGKGEREGGKFAGNCLSLPQSGIALETISPPAPLSLPPRISLCPREFQISFAEAETDRGGGGDCGSRKFSMAKSSIIAVSSSISSAGANVAMSQKNVQLFAGRQYLPLNPTAGGTRIPPKEEERWPATHVSE